MANHYHVVSLPSLSIIWLNTNCHTWFGLACLYLSNVFVAGQKSGLTALTAAAVPLSETGTLPQTPSTDESIVSFPHHTRRAAISLLQWLNWSITFYHPSFSKLSLSCKTTLRRSDIVVEIIWLSVCSPDHLSGWHLGVITAGEWVGFVIQGMYIQRKISICLELFRTYQILQCSIDKVTALLDYHIPR